MPPADEPVRVWGLPLVPVTFDQALDRIDELIAAGRPSLVITANLNFAMLADTNPRLRAVTERAALVLADGMPLVWWSKLGPRPLPERVAGSDLIYGICERAARLGHRVYLLGAGPGVADEAAAKLLQKYPGLQIAGVECPPFRKLLAAEEREQVERIKAARPDILFVAFGQPKGEFWIDDRLDRLGVPVCIQVGATLDFVAGRVKRSPKWMQKAGVEWVYRMLQEPGRLAKRYLDNFLFLVRAVFAPRFRRERRDAVTPTSRVSATTRTLSGARPCPHSPGPPFSSPVPPTSSSAASGTPSSANRGWPLWASAKQT